MSTQELEVLHIAFRKEDLSCVSEEEAVFFFQIGGLLQEIVSLQKWIHMSSHGVAPKWPRVVENAQGMYFLRSLAGTLYEAWSTLKSDRYRTVLAKYKSNWDDQTSEAYSEIEGYFDQRNNLCEKIRNNHSHHYNYGETRNMLRQWPENDEFDVILAEQYANCRVLAADTLTNYAIVGVSDPAAELGRYFTEVAEVARWFMEVAGSVLALIIRDVQAQRNLASAEERIADVPSLDEIRLHYFVSDDPI